MTLNTIFSALPHVPMTLTAFYTQSLYTSPGTNFLFKPKHPILNLEPLEGSPAFSSSSFIANIMQVCQFSGVSS